jgi:hypothetical protein
MANKTHWACALVAVGSVLATEAHGQEAKSTTKSRARSATKSTARPGPGTFVVQRIMAIADTNRDGSLTPDEAGNAASKLVKSAETKKNAAPSQSQLAQIINAQIRPQGMGPGGPPAGGGFGGPAGGPGGPPPDFGGPGGDGGDQAGGQARRNGPGQAGGNRGGPGGPPPDGFDGPGGPPPDGFGGPPGGGPGGPPPDGFGGPPGGGPGGPPGGFGGPGTMLAAAAVEYGDANGDGKLSSQEARAAAQKFIKELDKDKKGKVGAAALLEVVSRRVGPPGSLAPRASAILAYADTDKDGKLTPDEASAAATRFVRSLEGGGDGAVGADALARVMGMPGRRPTRGDSNPNADGPANGDDPGGPPPGGGPAGRIVALADGDGDGRVTPDEAGGAAAKLVREARSKDGGLDLEGLRDGLSKLAGPPPGGPPDDGPR